METAYGQSILRWKDLALEELLPSDNEEELRVKAVQARKMTNGVQSNNAGPHQQVPRNEGDQQEEGSNDEGEWEEEPSSAVSEYTSPEA